MVSEKSILTLITPARVLTAKDVIDAWNEIIKERRTNHCFRSRVPTINNTSIRYSKEVMAGIFKKPMWRLIYDPGFSIRDVAYILGSNSSKKPYHYLSNQWWFSSDSGHWSNKRSRPNYYLIRTTGMYSGMKWRAQESKLNGEITRMSSRLMIVASLSHFLLRGSFFEKNHWGPEADSENLRCASCINAKGFSIFNWGIGDSEASLAVYVVRKFDL